MFKELLSVFITPKCNIHKIEMKVYKHYTCETYWACPKCRELKKKNGRSN